MRSEHLAGETAAAQELRVIAPNISLSELSGKFSTLDTVSGNRAPVPPVVYSQKDLSTLPPRLFCARNRSWDIVIADPCRPIGAEALTTGWWIWIVHAEISQVKRLKR
jgi:hypothetical protein